MGGGLAVRRGLPPPPPTLPLSPVVVRSPRDATHKGGVLDDGRETVVRGVIVSFQSTHHLVYVGYPDVVQGVVVDADDVSLVLILVLVVLIPPHRVGGVVARRRFRDCRRSSAFLCPSLRTFFYSFLSQSLSWRDCVAAII